MTSRPRLCAGPTADGNQTEQRRFDELAALRTATMGTTLRDRSAVEAVAEAIGKEPATVYAMLDERVKSNPLSMLCAWLDACIAAKGAGNLNSLAPVRLLRDRYLDPRESAGNLLRDCADAMRETGEAVQIALGASGDGRIDLEEVARVECEIDQAIQKLNRMRRDLRAAVEGK